MKDRRDRVERIAAAAMERMGLRGAGVVCAVSGGADSVALLRCALRLREDLGLRVAACHFEHGIRGEASLEDLRFVQGLCRGLEVPLYVERADIPALAADLREGLESAARRARHAFYGRSVEHFAADVCLLAHHADDQAETVLMHALRGSRAALGMRERQGRIARPLLAIPKAELVRYAEDLGYREDATNRVPDNPRNALRLRVMPELARIYPGAVAALGRLAGFAGQDDDDLCAMARAWLCEARRKDAVALREVPPPSVLRRALCDYARDVGAQGLSAHDADRLCGLATAVPGMRLTLGEIVLERGGEDIHPVRERPAWEPVEIDLRREGGYRWGPWRIGVRGATRPERYGAKDALTQYFDADEMPRATLRARRTGDRFHAFGAPGGKALKKALIDLKIPRAARDLLPMLACGSEVCWAVGAARSDRAKVTCETTRIARVVFEKIEG